MTKFDILKTKLAGIQKDIAEYEVGDVALKSHEVDALYKALNETEREMKNSCPHDHAFLRGVTETDRGYGCDRHYYYHGVFCDDCEQDLGTVGSQSDISFGTRPLTKKIPLLELVRANQTLFTNEWLEKHGIRKNEHITRTYTIEKVR